MRHTLVACLFLLSCQKAAPKKLPPPDDYLGVVSVKSLDAAAAKLEAYLHGVTPGATLGLKGQTAAPALAMLVSARSLDGVAFDKPMHAVCLDPKKFPRPFVLVATVTDAQKLAAAVGEQNVRVKDGRAVIGDPKTVDAVATWAMASLTDGPDAPTVHLDLGRLVERYRAEIDGFRTQMAPMFASQPMMAKVLDAEMEILVRIGAQTEEVTASVDADAREASLEVVLVPRPGSTLEAFGKAQAPFTLDLLGKIPGVASADYVLAGTYRLGPVRDAVYDMLSGMLGAMAGAPPDAAFKKRWDAALDHFTGPVAAAARFEPGGGAVFSQIASVDDGPRTVADAKALFPLPAPRTFAVAAVNMTLELREKVDTHQGVPIDEYSLAFDFAAMPPEQQLIFKKMYGDKLRMALAGKDKLVYLTWGSDAIGAVKALLDGASDTPSPAARAALSAATGRKASFAMFMNLAGALSAMTGRTIKAESGITFELSFPDAASRLRIVVPAAHVREIQSMVAQ